MSITPLQRDEKGFPIPSGAKAIKRDENGFPIPSKSNVQHDEKGFPIPSGANTANQISTLLANNDSPSEANTLKPEVTQSVEAEKKGPIVKEGKYPVTDDTSLTKEELIQYLKASDMFCEFASRMGVESIEEALNYTVDMRDPDFMNKRSAQTLFNIFKTHLERWKDDPEDAGFPKNIIRVGKKSLNNVRRITAENGEKLYLDAQGNHYNLFLEKVNV